ncbi:Phosphoglycolate phosphatase [Candidatus Lokiarchaeum ossiferum]|uniref:Phosphoglycolate phosphatase n=1 Tax=Candidatus Lokiarchaeum ossiferum TaxID=2951803 RepID=A0ABY6HK74_9ARCH|nr:Phosphoglycolate phosphatase [Candidatus Lokiarchaeum sp. B-35]
MIKAVSFDFWFTLCTTSKDRDNKINNLRSDAIYIILREYGYADSKRRFQSHYDLSEKKISEEIINNGFIDYRMDVRISRFLEIILSSDPLLMQSLKREQKWNEVCERVGVPYMEKLMAIIPDAARNFEFVLNYLKEQGIKIALISNTGKSPGSILRKVLEFHGMLDYFDETIFSNEVEMIKPKREIFELLIDRVNLSPDEILHIGDGIFPDVGGANNAGMKSALYLGTLPENYSTRPTLEKDFHQIQPKYVIDDFQDLPDLITSINKNDPYFYRIRHHADILPASLYFLADSK